MIKENKILNYITTLAPLPAFISIIIMSVVINYTIGYNVFVIGTILLIGYSFLVGEVKK